MTIYIIIYLTRTSKTKQQANDDTLRYYLWDAVDGQTNKYLTANCCGEHDFSIWKCLPYVILIWFRKNVDFQSITKTSSEPDYWVALLSIYIGI